jgi:hypothetical protein
MIATLNYWEGGHHHTGSRLQQIGEFAIISAQSI